MWENADQNNSEYGHFLRSLLAKNIYPMLAEQIKDVLCKFC